MQETEEVIKTSSDGSEESFILVRTEAGLTMSVTLRIPYEKTMAFGGVATGSMKAKEALRVQGIITYRGFRLMDWD